MENQLKAIKILAMLGYERIDASVLFKTSQEICPLCPFEVEYIKNTDEYCLRSFVKEFNFDSPLYFNSELKLSKYLKEWESKNNNYKFIAIKSLWDMGSFFERNYNPLNFVDHISYSNGMSEILHNIFYILKYKRKPVSINDFIETYPNHKNVLKSI